MNDLKTTVKIASTQCSKRPMFSPLRPEFKSCSGHRLRCRKKERKKTTYQQDKHLRNALHVGENKKTVIKYSFEAVFAFNVILPACNQCWSNMFFKVISIFKNLTPTVPTWITLTN